MHQCITNYYVNVNLKKWWMLLQKTTRVMRCARYRDVNTSFREKKVKQVVVHECYVCDDPGR